MIGSWAARIESWADKIGSWAARILSIRPKRLIGRVLGHGGEEPGGGNRQVGQDPKVADWDPIALGLQGNQTGIPLAPGLLDRGKDYALQPDAPGKQGPAYSV